MFSILPIPKSFRLPQAPRSHLPSPLRPKSRPISHIPYKQSVDGDGGRRGGVWVVVLRLDLKEVRTRAIGWPRAYARMISSVKAIERLHLCSYSFKRLPLRCPQVESFCSPCQKRKLAGALRSQISRSLKRLDMGFQAKAGAVLPATCDHLKEAINAITTGQVIAVPTDTLYGFACDACSAQAVNRIYEIKGRKQMSPLAICVADVSDISRFAIVDHLPQGLLDSLLPGPVTVVLRRGESSMLEKSLNPGLDTIGVRVPNYEFIRAIARGSKSALALTSANLSGQSSSVNTKDFEDLWQHCAYVYDGGMLPSGRAGSTVVDLVKPGVYKILRPGSAEEETKTVLEKFFFQEAA